MTSPRGSSTASEPEISTGTSDASTPASRYWRIECRWCGAWLATYLRPDVEGWLNFHEHREAL